MAAPHPTPAAPLPTPQFDRFYRHAELSQLLADYAAARPDLVERSGWLTDAQLLDAVAVGQLTPGPVLTTATFIGYQIAAVPGAIVATVGIFLPSFVFVALSSPLVPRLRRSPRAAGLLDGANAASVALMALVTWQLGRAAIVDWVTAGLAVVSAVLVLSTRVNSAWLVAGGARGWAPSSPNGRKPTSAG